MDEQTDKQNANPETGAEASDAAAGTAPVQGATPTDEQIQSYLASKPDALKNLKTKVKVDGREMDVPLSEVVSGYQLRSASQRRFEEAAAKEKELTAREAKLAEQGDPINQLLERLRPTPQQPDTPLEGLDLANDPFAAMPRLAEVTRGLYKANQAQEAKLKEYEKELPKVKELANSAREAQRNYEIRMRVESDFEKARLHNPDFTGRLVVDPKDGKFLYDMGSNPYVTREAITLANSETPDERLGGKAGITMTLPEIADALSADLDKRAEAKKVAVAEAKQARLKNLAGMSQAGAVTPESLPKTTILPTDDAKTIREKTALIRREIQEQMVADGIHTG